MDNRIDKNSPIPLYYQIERIIIEEIESGKFPVGSLIPTEKELSDFFDVSRTTVRQAIIDLARDGRLYRVKGKGTFVKKQKISQGFEKTPNSFCSDVAKTGRTARTEVLDVEKVELPSYIANELGVPLGEKVVKITRLFYADNMPIIKSDSYLRKVSIAECMKHDFAKESYSSILSTNPNTAVYRTVRTCEACVAGSDDVKLLQTKKGSPILFTKMLGYNRDEELIEYTVSRHRGDSSKFSIELYEGREV